MLSIVGWLICYQLAKPQWVADEQRHVLVIQWFAEGKPLPPGFLPMLPLYHWVAAGVAKLYGATLLTVRTFNACLALAALLLLAAAVRRREPQTDGARLLLFAWNPLLFPLFAMVYTEAAAILALAAAFYCHVRRWWVISAGALLLACILRQSTIVWVLFFAAWALWTDEDPRRNVPGASWRERLRSPAVWRRIWPHALLLAAGGLAFVLNPAFAAGLEYGNRAQFNPAQFYVFGLTVALIGLPLWIQVFARAWSRCFAPALAWGGVCALLLAGIGFLESAFVNPHPWNGDPLYLRNLPLLAMQRSLLLRLALALLLVALSAIIWRYVTQPHAGRLLRLVVVISLLYLVPHYLVDPRYYILPVVFFDLFAPYTPARRWLLVSWQALLTLATCAYILAQGSPHGGMP